MNAGATIGSVSGVKYIFVRDTDGQLGRMEVDDSGQPVGMRDVLTPSGKWIPYYCDGSEISEAQAVALARSWGVDPVVLYGPREAVPEDAQVSVEKDPYG